MMSPQKLWLFIAGIMAVVMATMASDYYENMLIEDLYKRLSELDDEYFVPEEQQGWMDPIPLDSRDSNQADLRDHEYLEHGSNSEGWQKISGGAGEGQQHLTPEGTQNNTAEVKSDEALPFYCHPPNPCPKGYTSKDGCQEDNKDTAEHQKKWIEGMQNRGICSCDQEHMFECTDDSKAPNQESDENTRDALNVVLDSLLSEGYKDPNPYMKDGMKRAKVVAKKSPGMFKRSVRSVTAEEMDYNNLRKATEKRNPFLAGKRLPTIAKKGLQYQNH